MRVFIIEDEPIARDNLTRLLRENFDDMEVAGSAGSVKDAVAWLNTPGNRPDIIFMDVELSDGNSFEILRETEIDVPVIMTTAYDNYALKAFEINSVDYLLKPIEAGALRRAVGRCREEVSKASLEQLMSAFRPSGQEARKRFIVKLNDNIIPVSVEDIAYIYAEDKSTWIVTRDGSKYIMDKSLDIISSDLDSRKFFRISRSCIICIDAIDSITKQFGGRLLLTARPRSEFDMTVSRSRVEDFLAWLEN